MKPGDLVAMHTHYIPEWSKHVLTKGDIMTVVSVTRFFTRCYSPILGRVVNITTANISDNKSFYLIRKG